MTYEPKPPAPDAQFLLGGDISMLARIEQCGGVFRQDGQARDATRILQDHACNCFRLRLFVNPSHENAARAYGKDILVVESVRATPGGRGHGCQHPQDTLHGVLPPL